MSAEMGSVNPHMPNIQRGSLTGVHLAIIMVATAMIAADRYYCQPLLAEMGRTLHLTPSVTGLVCWDFSREADREHREESRVYRGARLQSFLPR
jgi:hypothetical protein